MKVLKINKILVPVSLAGDGENAFKQALFFRRILSAKITLLHVVSSGSRFGNVVQSDIVRSLQARAMVRLVRFVKIHFKGRIPENIELRVEIGSHILKTAEIARDENFDLIIINKTKKSNALIDKFKKHSADRLIDDSICPVLAVESRWTNRGIRDILVPVDVSRRSGDLLEWSIFMGNLLNARIHLLTALQVKIKLERSLAFKKAHIMKELIVRAGVNCKVTIVEREEETRLNALLLGAKKQSADLVMVQGHQEMIFSGGQGAKLVTGFLHSSSVPVLCLGIDQNCFFANLLGAGNYSPIKYKVSN
ncbi:universal stress protein [Labilibaculum manganireducens]|uniref:universal stress protein n=1 Tax=Labilibaculum manganireducens TaxID=1940525 RepID=UPI0029F50FB8|nr:universal stress protein [Labilibaculum manganireducens]